MKISELTEGISQQESLKTIVDILKTEIPPLYNQLKVAAENYYKRHRPIR